MIMQTFFAACEEQLGEITASIAEAQGALSAEEDRERAELLRVRIKYLEKLLEVVKSFRSETLRASAAVGEMEARFIRWHALCADARVAQDKMEALAINVESARLACVPAQNDVAIAEAAFGKQQRTPLPRFATEPEIRRAKAVEDELRKKYDGAIAKLGELARVRDETHAAWVKAAKAFDEACFHERMSRLPDEPPAYKSPGELRHVA